MEQTRGGQATMGLLEIAQTVYPKISIVSIPLLVLGLIPHLFPTRSSGISPVARISPPTISLVCWTVARAVTTILDHVLLKKELDGQEVRDDYQLLCGVDAIVTTALLTGMAAHLPPVLLHRYQTLPTPAVPAPPSPAKSRTALVFFLIYTYALVPCVPTLSAAATVGFDLPDGTAVWWGFYCIDRADWFRIVRSLTLLPPIVLSIPIAFLLFSTLYSTSGHPSPHIRPSGRTWAQAGFVFVLLLSAAAFFALEQVVGWREDWWPRLLEALTGPILVICLLTDPHIWIAYFSWIRFRRPPQPSSMPASPTDPLLSPTSPDSSLEHKHKHKRSSSFFVPPPTNHTYTKAVHFPPTPDRTERIPYRNTMSIFSCRTDRTESLLPPPRRGDGEKQGIDLERGLHPHPHSIKDGYSPPINLGPKQDENTFTNSEARAAPTLQLNNVAYPGTEETLQAPDQAFDPENARAYSPGPHGFGRLRTPNGDPDPTRRYTNSTDSTTSPFAYEAFATLYSRRSGMSTMTDSNETASTAFPYTTASIYTDRMPFPAPTPHKEGPRDTYDGGVVRSVSGRGKRSELDLPGGLGGAPLAPGWGRQVGALRADRRSVIPSVHMIEEEPEPPAGAFQVEQLLVPRPVATARLGQKERPERPGTHVSSLYSQDSLLEDYTGPRIVGRAQYTDHRLGQQPLTEQGVISTQSNANGAEGGEGSTQHRAPSNYTYSRAPSGYVLPQSQAHAHAHPGNRGPPSVQSRGPSPRATGTPDSTVMGRPHQRTSSALSGPSVYTDAGSGHPLDTLEEEGLITFPQPAARDHHDGSAGQRLGTVGQPRYLYGEKLRGHPSPPHGVDRARCGRDHREQTVRHSSA